MASLQAHLAVWFTKWRVKRRLKGVRDYRRAREVLRPLPYKVPAAVRITPAQVDYINAHGTGTPLNDSAEATAICRWANGNVARLPVSSTKASIGHLLGAAGAVEAVVCVMALNGQWLPPQAAFETPDPACRFPVVSQPQDTPIRIALSNSFGFGGVNATLALRRWS